MTISAPASLTFAQVDDLAFAADRGRLADGVPSSVRLSARELGPFLELSHLAEDGLIPSPQTGAWLALNSMTSLNHAMAEGRRQWMCRETRSIGFLRTEQQPPADTTAWTAFGLAAQKAAVAAGFSNTVAGQLVGALVAMQSNIYEHSEASQSGLLAFRAVAGVFEFVVADRGIGVLESLRSGVAHAGLIDHGTALEVTLTEGCSRFGDGIGRGMGFRPLFVGLANLRGELRFRSGDHALIITEPILAWSARGSHKSLPYAASLPAFAVCVHAPG
jgi:anti-sigma regulatory factor (Ser/Thr protein kinase)